ncbi:MAG: PEP-CTERM sorting domain-containing protein [Proteobacteria bacterium]|nr:PEP-CTERM sorting domain-containing protein [Pseudomonadota bacterium]
MKKTLLLLSLIGGLASASAATYNISDQDNNLFLGFYAADEVSTKSVLINLGTSADVFKGFTLDLSSASSALSSAYGTNWFNNSQVYWGLIGYDGAYGNYGSVYVARPTIQPLLNTDVLGSTALTEDQYWTLSDKIGALVNAHNAGAAVFSQVLGSAGNTHQISIMDNGGSTFNVLANANFSSFTSAVYEQITGGLSIQQFTYDGSSSFPTAFDGTFGNITQAGGVITVVPEPSTYALLGLGGLLLIMAYRRRA